MRSGNRLLTSGYLLALLVFALPVHADDPYPDWSLCGDGEMFLEPPDLGPLPIDQADNKFPIQITADQADISQDGVSVFDGNVIGQQGSRFITAEHLEYDSSQGTVAAPEGMRFGRDDLVVDGKHAEIDLESDLGIFDDVEYSIPRRHGRGTADRIETFGDELTRIYDLRYTTCPPQTKGWELVAKKLRLNHEKQVGFGTNVFVKFKGVPVFWTPYISFPLGNQRKSGFLIPEISESNRAGFTLGLPHYWNLAPNLDLLMTPRFMSTRGNMLINDFRYMTTGAEGEFHVETLPDDKVINISREFYSWNQRTNLNRNLRSLINMNHVSDVDYFNDLGDSLRGTRVTYLPRSANLEYIDDKLRIVSLTQSYQVLDETIPDSRRPYAILPSVRVSYSEPLGPAGFSYGGASSITRFVRNNSIEGNRLYMKPKLSWRNNDPGWFVQPSVGFQAMNYDLTEADGSSRAASVFASVLSLDSGLIFERPVKNESFMQTLEPRIFYLYVPTRDHGSIPDFDSNVKDINFASLFSDNRFVGGDRLGDANQVTLAMTTNILDNASGATVFSASIGQIYHFANRHVNLNNSNQIDASDRSPVIGEIRVNPSEQWSASATVAWDSEINQMDKYALQFQFNPTTDTILNLSYRFRRNTRPGGFPNGIEQTDVSYATPITKRWKAVGRWQYSLVDRRSMETFVGFEYESCCFTIRAVNRRFIIDNFGNTDRQLYFQLELKGMTSVGRKVDDFLEEGIFGYE